MAITSIAQMAAATKQPVRLLKTPMSTNQLGRSWVSSWRIPGLPAAGADAPAYTAGSGYACSKATLGAVQFRNAITANRIYNARLMMSAAGEGRFAILDRLWACSGMGFAAATYTVTTPGSLPARITDGGVGCEIWVSSEGGVAQPAGDITINYLNTAGASKSVTMTTTVSVLAASDTFRVPLAAGDVGVSQIVSVVLGSSWTTSTFGIAVLKPVLELHFQEVRLIYPDWTWKETGLPVLHDDACLITHTAAAANGVVIPLLRLDLVDL